MLRLIEGSSDQSDDKALLARRLVGAKDTIRLLEEEVDRLGLMVSPDLGALTAQLTCPQCLGTMRSVMSTCTKPIVHRPVIARTVESLGRTLINPVSQSDSIGGKAADYGYREGALRKEPASTMTSFESFGVNPSHPVTTDCVASHFFFIIQSDVAGSLRLQLDGVSRAVGGALRGYVAAETHDHPATGRTIVPSLRLQLVTQDLRIVDLLTMLVEGGVDDAPLNQNQVGCRCWCYRAMKLMEE
ncbi:hypothetical protein EV421DRAFT_1743545 [Armillaria borealis]|uniref:Uncharacterized protein n=1 Tax=Armillaria borealis TaxID=47425 RepID=A0AA39IWT2_9AGAR|nr:hypothetical protein EV421DRAFT_1743545 [Armillaria borealis]